MKKTFMIKAVMASVLMLAATAQAALVGDVTVNGYTTGQQTGTAPLQFTLTPSVFTSVTGTGDFGSLIPSIDLSTTTPVPYGTTPNVVDFKPIVLTQQPVIPALAPYISMWRLDSTLELSFGERTFKSVTADLKFVVDPGADFIGRPDNQINKYSFMEATDLKGSWYFNGQFEGTAHLNLTKITSDSIDQFQLAITSVPEPSTYLAGLGALGMLGVLSWRTRKH